MLTAFNITLQGDVWWYQKQAVSLHRHSEEKAPDDYLGEKSLRTLLLRQQKSLITNH